MKFLQLKIAVALFISFLTNGQNNISFTTQNQIENFNNSQFTNQGCNELFFSEYADGYANNKYYEIYNPTSVSVSLSGYVVSVFPNGSTSSSNWLSFSSNSIIGPNGIYIVANPNADTAILNYADTTSNTASFNGNDALALFNGTDTLDIIGVIGIDPGSGWTVGTGVGTGSTKDYTLVRSDTFSSGTTNWTMGTNQWQVFPQNDTSHLGWHSSLCLAPPASGPPSMTVDTSGNYKDPFWLAENILSPNGNKVYNVDNDVVNLIQPQNTQLGYFKANDISFPIQSGVVMVAAQNATDVISASNGAGKDVTFTDSELATILTQLGSNGYSLKDMASIEFSFIAQSDSFKLNYVFGSHEYDGYTCSNFNDVLGIFLEGPKVDSLIALPGSSVIKNVAVIPNSNIPVAVNTVNSGSPSGPYPAMNCSSANPNYVSDSQYFNSSNSSITTLDGYTDKFAAKAAIQCGALYTVRIKIANVSDNVLSPAVFIESGSLIGNENNGSVCSNYIPDYIPINGLKVYYPLDTLGSSNHSPSGDSSVGRDLGFFNHHWNAGSSYIPKTNRFGVPGGAMSYTQNMAQTPYSGVLGTESRSVSIWVKHKGYSSDPVFFQYGSQLAGKRFSGHVNYNCNGVGVSSAFSTTTNNQALDTNWHHIVYVLDTSQCSGSCSVADVDVYLDGVMYPNCNVFNGSTALNTIGNFDLQFIFGNSTIADSNRLALDDFGMWDRPLTQDEILDLYSGSTGPKAVADLQACYYSDDIVSLSWTAPADTGGDFLGFIIYRADSLNDSFRVVDTLFDYVSTYLDTTPYIPADFTVICTKDPYRYFIKTIDGFGRESITADTIRNLVLNFRSFLGPGNTGLTWNKTHSDNVSKEFLVYETQFWSGNWMVIDTSKYFYNSQCFYGNPLDQVQHNCAGFYPKYKVGYANGCFSNVDSIYQEDIYPPIQENEVQNTFTPQNELSISFIESADSSGIAQYLLYYKDSLNFNVNPIDSIERQTYLFNGWYTSLSPLVINSKAELLIVPKDTCGNSAMAFNLWSGATTQPVYLDVQYNAGDVKLDWNPREVDSGNVFYSIYEAMYDGSGAGTYTLVTNTLDTSADMSLSNSYENYCYYVSATSSTSNFVMESNRVCVSFVGMDENDFSFNLHPNPSNGDFLININSGNAGDYEMELLNNMGQVVYRTTLKNGDNHIELDHRIAKGSYILVLKDKNSQAVKREVLILQ